MKHFMMTDRKDKSKGAQATPTSGQSRRTDAAFDLFLQRGLHELYGRFAEEPIPAELLKLIEDDKAK